MADYTPGLINALQQGIGSYFQASERKKDRDAQLAQSEADRAFRQQSLEADFYKSGLLPKYDEAGTRIIGADVNESVMQARQASDPMHGLIKQMQLQNLQTENQEKARGTEGERKAVTFAKRMQDSENIFNKLESGGYDRASVGEGIRSKVSGFLPVAKSKESGQQEQAERNFINSVLRRESGAAISPGEFENAALQYFPRVGDTPEVLQQKRQNRMAATQGIEQEAGRAFEYQKKQGLVGQGISPQQAQAKQMSPEDQQAMQWAQSNPNDPRSKEIMKRLGQ